MRKENEKRHITRISPKRIDDFENQLDDYTILCSAYNQSSIALDGLSAKAQELVVSRRSFMKRLLLVMKKDLYADSKRLGLLHDFLQINKLFYHSSIARITHRRVALKLSEERQQYRVFDPQEVKIWLGDKSRDLTKYSRITIVSGKLPGQQNPGVFIQFREKNGQTATADLSYVPFSISCPTPEIPHLDRSVSNPEAFQLRPHTCLVDSSLN